jgi:regulatory protein
MDTRRAPRKLDSNGLWDYALRILAQRPNSSSELKKKLSRRADSTASVTIVLEKLREYGLADDVKFSETFATARLQNQGFGPSRVLRDLRAKQVSPRVAQEAIDRTFAGVDEIELAKRFLERKYRGKDPARLFAEEKALAAAYRRLRMAGFSSGASISALKSYSKRADELQELPDDE